MVVTRSRSGESKKEKAQQEPSATAKPGASEPAPETGTSVVAEMDTGSGSTENTSTDITQTTATTEDTRGTKTTGSHGTLKPGDTRSRRSTALKKKHLAELEAKERLAEMKVKQAQAERELQEIHLQRVRAEADSSEEDDDMVDDLASVRIGTWLARPAPPPGGETRPPPHDDSGGRTGRDAAKDTGAATGAQPPRDDDQEESVRNPVSAKMNKGNIASDKVLQGNTVNDRMIDVGTLAAALAQAARSSREPPKYIQQLPIFDGKPVRVPSQIHKSVLIKQRAPIQSTRCTKPVANAELYLNENDYYSIFAQIICDADCNIQSVDASFAGGHHHCDIWCTHPISTHLERLEETAYILGSNDYNVEDHLMTPLPDYLNGDPPECRYNEIHRATYATIQQTIYKLKSRWRCLLARKELHYDHEMAGKIVIACCILHNICNMEGLEAPEMSESDIEEERKRQHEFSDSYLDCDCNDERIKLVYRIEEIRLKSCDNTMEATED